METSSAFISISATWIARHTACYPPNLFLDWNVQSPEGTSSFSYTGLIHIPTSSCWGSLNRFPKFSSSSHTKSIPIVPLSTSLQRMFRQSPQRQEKLWRAGKRTGGQQRLRVRMGPDSVLSHPLRRRCRSYLKHTDRDGECLADQFGRSSSRPWKGPGSWKGPRSWSRGWSQSGLLWPKRRRSREPGGIYVETCLPNLLFRSTSSYKWCIIKSRKFDISVFLTFPWIVNPLSRRINLLSSKASQRFFSNLYQTQDIFYPYLPILKPKDVFFLEILVSKALFLFFLTNSNFPLKRFNWLQDREKSQRHWHYQIYSPII